MDLTQIINMEGYKIHRETYYLSHVKEFDVLEYFHYVKIFDINGQPLHEKPTSRMLLVDQHDDQNLKISATHLQRCRFYINRVFFYDGNRLLKILATHDVGGFPPFQEFEVTNNILRYPASFIFYDQRSYPNEIIKSIITSFFPKLFQLKASVFKLKVEQKNHFTL